MEANQDEEIQVGQEGSNIVQDEQESVTDTGESHDIPEISTIDAEKENWDTQEALLEN